MQAMAAHLEIVKGPLDDAHIRDIGETAGQFDPRYRSLDFCRRMFNENVYGFSFHVFARDGDRAIGHNSAIPFRLRQGADRVFSAKAEALFLDEAYRNFTVKLGARQVPIGIALIRQAYESAFDDGVEFLFDITTPTIGAILQRMLGFSEISIDRDHYYR